MSWLLIVILIVATIFFVWQLVLFIKDLIKHIKAKKAKNQSVDDSTDRKDMKK